MPVPAGEAPLLMQPIAAPCTLARSQLHKAQGLCTQPRLALSTAGAPRSQPPSQAAMSGEPVSLSALSPQELVQVRHSRHRRLPVDRRR